MVEELVDLDIVVRHIHVEETVAEEHQTFELLRHRPMLELL